MLLVARGGSGSSETSTSDSPSREHLRSLNQTQHANTSVPGFEARTTFMSHVTYQILPEGGLPPPSQPGSSGRRPSAPALQPGDESSDDEIYDEAFAAELQAQQDAWDLEYNTEKNKLSQSEEQAAAHAQRKKDRDSSRAARKQALMEEAKKKHLDRMTQLQTHSSRSSALDSSKNSAS